MINEYRLVKVKNGICRFARVTVEAQIIESGIEVSDEIREPIEESQCEVNRRGYPDWIDAALRGARLCVEQLVQSQKVSGGRVVVIRVIGTDVDTSPEDVACAAALATWQALNPTADLPPFDFADGKWNIEFGG